MEDIFMADINKKKIMDLAETLGFSEPNESKMKMIEDAASQYKGKSEKEIMEEIKSLKKNLFSDKEKFEKQLKAIKDIRVMLNEEQKNKLDKVIDLLTKEE